MFLFCATTFIGMAALRAWTRHQVNMECEDLKINGYLTPQEEARRAGREYHGHVFANNNAFLAWQSSQGPEDWWNHR